MCEYCFFLYFLSTSPFLSHWYKGEARYIYICNTAKQKTFHDCRSVDRTEKSTDQVIKPVNIEALSKWVGEIPDDVVSDMHNIAPMLLTLGYDPYANPPNYGKPDPEVADNTLHIRTNREFWKQKEKDIFDHLDVDENPKQRPSKNGVVELGIREGQGQGHENDANRYANESGRSR